MHGASRIHYFLSEPADFRTSDAARPYNIIYYYYIAYNNSKGMCKLHQQYHFSILFLVITLSEGGRGLNQVKSNIRTFKCTRTIVNFTDKYEISKSSPIYCNAFFIEKFKNLIHRYTRDGS